MSKYLVVIKNYMYRYEKALKCKKKSPTMLYERVIDYATYYRA